MRIEEIEKRFKSYKEGDPLAFQDLILLYKDYFSKLLGIAKALKEMRDSESYALSSKSLKALQELEGEK